MKFALIGPGAMGLLYGGKLSACVDMVLIGNNKKHIDEINEQGVFIKAEEDRHYPVKAFVSGEYNEKCDLVILFTKAYQTREALLANKAIIGDSTYILTLQNGAGHEEVINEFVPREQVLVGTTAQGSFRENAYTIINSGLGETFIGNPYGIDSNKIIEIADIFVKAGFPCKVSDNIRWTVWNKLMINASSSALSGVLQKPQGYVATNEFAWDICTDLIKELCEVATKDGCEFKAEEQVARIKAHLANAPTGIPSISVDIKNGRKTEVDYISGAVVRAAAKYDLSVPTHKLMIKLVHAMEK